MHLERTFGSETRVKVLRTLFQESLPRLDLTALALETGKSRAGVYNAVSEILPTRLIAGDAQGRTTYFSANVDHAMFEVVSTLFRQEREKSRVPHLFPTYWNHLEPIAQRMAAAPGVKLVLLFGSLARPPLYPSADADVLVVHDPKKRPHFPRMTLMDHPVQVVPLTTDAFASKIGANDEFVTRALERHAVLYQATDYDLPWTRRPATPASSGRFRGRGRK